MSRISMALAGGALVYALLFGIELFRGHILWQAIIGIVAVMILALLPCTQK